ncbi:type III-A CRISPR-associated RAMP protein Csm3 [Dehalococcoidales bacterium]|nr:type III-A CRISPR-associated RAMP protein Csm3 [Dehalococcoidales bacterium]
MGLKGHVLIEGHVKCLTGLHIGAAAETIEIGGIDSPVVRNPITREPYIPGSSLKGKMRSLLERILATDGGFFNREGPKGEKNWRHECKTTEEAKGCPVCRIFGSTGDKDNPGKNHPALLVVRDGSLRNPEYLKKEGIVITEAKMENNLNRITAQADPRTIERVPAGTEFDLNMVYAINEDAQPDEDLRNLLDVLKLIAERDGIGGNVSRGYGRVEFHISRLEGIRIDGTFAGGLKPAVEGEEYSWEQCQNAISEINLQ